MRKMAIPNALTLCCRHLLRKSKLLKCGQSWTKCTTRLVGSKSDSDKSSKWPNGPPSPASGFGSDLPNPVRNTEWEYFERIRNPQYEEEIPVDGAVYTRKQGITKLLYSWLQWDVNINDTEELIAIAKQRRWRKLAEDQKFDLKRHKVLGPDLSVAHLIVARGGAVKFRGREIWVAKNAHGKYNLPRAYVENLHVEAIDASNTQFTYVALDNFDELEHLRFLRFRNCEFVDDSCLARLQRLKHSLEFLDLSECPQVTDRGIASLHNLSNLQGLYLSKMSGVKHLGLLTLLLEEHLPNLQIVGVTPDDLRPPPWAHRGERKLVQALLGLAEMNEENHPEEFDEYIGKYSHDGAIVHSRTVRRVD